MRRLHRGVVTTLVFALTLSCGPCGGSSTGDLLRNGGFDQADGSKDGSQVSTPAWAMTGRATAVRYGADNGYPTAKDPGPPDRGRNFLAGGGDGNVGTATQTVDLAAYSGSIDGGSQRYQLSGWLGGWTTQADDAVVTVYFEDASGRRLGSGKIGPVTPAERRDKTGFLFRSLGSTVPAHARRAIVVVTMTRFEGTANDGYVDSLELKLTS